MTLTQRFVWYRGRVWLDTGMRDYRGHLCLWSLTRDGDGVTPAPREVCSVDGSQLTACHRIWGTDVSGIDR